MRIMHLMLFCIKKIYLIEEFDKSECAGPTVGPAKKIRDTKKAGEPGYHDDAINTSLNTKVREQYSQSKRRYMTKLNF